MESRKIKIAFIKFGGLSAGGTERWLQMMAASLPKENFAVDYYYCDAAPYIGSDYKHADTDPARKKYLEDRGIKLMKFKVGAKDMTTPTYEWRDTDFWEIFNENNYDIIQTAKAGPAEYPFYLIKKPIVECLTLSVGADTSPNIAWTILLSEWQRTRWFKTGGGNLQKSSVIPIPVEKPASRENLRQELGIPKNALVAGFHQRADDNIFSPVPLAAFAKLQAPDRYFIIKGGGDKYRAQAEKLNLKNVIFIDHSGDAEKISKFLNTLDIFAHGRRDGETFGAVLAEAMMHGLPCLSHWSPIANAQPETMGPSGLFALNKKDYREKLELLFTDKNLRAKLSAKGLAHATEYFSPESATTELANIYCQIMGLPETVKREKIPYGYSKMGFLYSGPITDESSIAHCVANGEVPEEFEVMIVRHFLPGVKNFIDIGANIGIYCFVAAKNCPADAKILAYEPQPNCSKILEKTIFLNNWEEKVKAFNLGIADKEGKMELHLAGTGSSFNNAFNDNANLQKTVVLTDTLDNQVKKNLNGKVDFIKIDVEGFEQKVLEGGIETIKRDQPIIFIEIADHIRGRNYRNPNYQKTIAWLKEKGYIIYRAEENYRLTKIGKNPQAEHINMYLCLPKKLGKEIIPLAIKTVIYRLTAVKKKILKRTKHLLRKKLPWPIIKIIKKYV
jgi:FkbM family methyltransferase